MLEPSHRDSSELRTRMRREAIMLSGVESPHVGRILGFGYEDEQPFLILERLHGETLADRLKREGRVPIADLVLWIERARAVVSGDSLADLGPGLALNEWLRGGVTREQVLQRMRPLLELPVEIVLPAHGPATGRAALERALS